MCFVFTFSMLIKKRYGNTVFISNVNQTSTKYLPLRQRMMLGLKLKRFFARNREASYVTLKEKSKKYHSLNCRVVTEIQYTLVGY